MEKNHIHGCFECNPGMVPDFDYNDRRYHRYNKCGVTLQVTLDGSNIEYTRGAFEGVDGWVLFVGDIDEIHDCPNCTVRDSNGVILSREVCVEPKFGNVVVNHVCPART